MSTRVETSTISAPPCELAPKNLAAELEKTKKEFEDLVYAVSHDLKEPLRGMMTLAQFLREDCYQSLNEDGRKHLDRLDSTGARMSQLLDGLLEYSRIKESGLRYSDVNVAVIALNALDALSADLVDERCQIDIADDTPMIRGDRQMLKKLLQHLFSNGLTYNTSIPKKIHLSYDRKCNTYSIEDNGIGVEESQIDTIFRPLAHMDGDRGRIRSGAGLGLSIAKKIAVLHGGQLWLEKTSNSGSVFAFSLEPSRSIEE